MLPTRDASDRLLPSHVSSYEYPRLVGSRRVTALARLRGRGKIRLVHGQCDSLRWAARSWFIAVGVLGPIVMRDDRTSDISVASFSGTRPLAWTGLRRRPPRPHPARPRERCELEKRSEMPSIEQGPSPRNALSSARLRTSPGSRLGRRDLWLSRRLVHPPEPLRDSRSRAPVHAPRCQRVTRFSGPGVACRFLQPDTTRGHTLTSRRPSHASEAFAPLLAGTNRCRLRWPARTLPYGGPASRDLYTTTLRSPCSACADGTGCGPKTLEQRRARVLGRIRACPSRWRLGHPGHRLGS